MAMSILKAVYAEMFINEVKIERECDTDDCEYEVTLKAMEMYLKYPCYREWEIFLYGSTLSHYLCYERINKNGYRGDSDYRGACLLKNKNKENKKALTADILTSIKSPINRLVKEKYDTGEKTWKAVLNIDTDFKCNLKEEYKEIANYIKTFAYVYYWCGNMMPVICNPLRTGNGGDTWMKKMRIIHESFENPNITITIANLEKNIKAGLKWTELWPQWINLYWIQKNKKDKIKDIEKDFIFKNYLRDMFEMNNNEVVKVKQLSNHVDKNWFLNNAKLIIQRSYRIQYQFSKDWKDSAKDEENVKSIMRYVFKQAGFNEKEIEAENLATIF